MLEEAIGAASHRVVESPNPEPGLPAEEVPEAEPSPLVHERALEGGDQDPGGGPVLLTLAAVLGLVGLVVAWRVR